MWMWMDSVLMSAMCRCPDDGARASRMPADEDYARRTIAQPQQPSVACPVACLSPDLHYDDGRYHTDRFGGSERLATGERYQLVSERYPLGERAPPTSVSNERLHHAYERRFTQPERYHPDAYAYRTKRKYQYVPERFPPIPCPERFATGGGVVVGGAGGGYDVPGYVEPPSPAPAADRFVPPPLSPTPDCYTNNAFPSPTVPPGERFVPPPPLSPSPTETYSPKHKRYYHDRYYGDKVVNERCYAGERYVPPTAHVPVERYVPQQEQQYYPAGYYERYPKYDPYMRRDLTFHYRLPLVYPAGQYQRVRYTGTNQRPIKCCDAYQLAAKSSPGGSSSGGSAKETCVVECQNYYQQEKGTQCGTMVPPLTQPTAKECGYVTTSTAAMPTRNPNKCRHAICASPSVEYVGASGGRHVCATPPPPRGSVGSADGSLCCSEGCCTRRSHNSLTVAVWRTTPPQPTSAPNQQQPSPALQPPIPQSHATTDAPDGDGTISSDPNPSAKAEISVQRAVSLPAAPIERQRAAPTQLRTQSERLPERPTLARSLSKKEMLKNYIRKETALFFGVDEENEDEQQLRWLDRRKRMASRAYGPLKDEYQAGTVRHRRSEPPPPVQLQTERPDVLPGADDALDSGTRPVEVTLRRKDSVARMTWDGLSYVVNTLTRHRPRPRSQHHQWSRSFEPDIPITPTEDTDASEDVFFETPGDEVERIERRVSTEESSVRSAFHPQHRPSGWRRDPHVTLRHDASNRPTTVGGTRIFTALLDNVLDNSDRRQYGMGWVGRMFGRSLRKSVAQKDDVRQQLDDMEDHRPMFTYWVTTVQILVLFISLICYGFGPFGLDLQTRSGQVLVTSLSLQQVDYLEPANFWFGPRAGDLIHLGAKFAPCMRVDDKISMQIDKIRAKERETACCIRNDDSGCVQSSQADCSVRGLRPTKTISTWKKWSAGDAGPGGRISGSVCGLDPKFCDAPASVHPYEWPDDITKWPICRKTNTQFSVQKHDPRDKIAAEHMVCEVIGHPCCIGIHGQCKITTREYCDFVRGTFHEEASLCSQVSCLNDVCGMLPFYFPETPDQFYRLWTSLFLHAGILQLAVTVIIQYFLMRDLEKLTGSLRIAIIYLGSGVAGNLASAIFVPYRADVGPAGSQFGLLACLIVEVLNAWPMLKRPHHALFKLLAITGALFLVGLLPWVDNYAHLFGFIFGFLLSYALLPFVAFGRYDRHKKIALIWVCLLSAAFLFACLVLLFYVIPVYDCQICTYFNCLPITKDFCASQNINFKREEPIV